MTADIKESTQYLTFILDNDVFAFNVLTIKEVLELSKITRMPKAPFYMAGIINLRGGVIPVIDLRLYFNLEKKNYTKDTSIIIVEINYDNEPIFLGVLVDSVKLVIKIEAKDTEPPPKIGMKLNTNLIESIGKYKNEFVMILNADQIFSEKELNLIQETMGEVQKEEQTTE